ncbi:MULTISPECIES: hypothetical protein [Methylobacterium]|uniref:hypothetical protein n=1 Tax=Methylobacterium TaxID=407 RepID=UPI0014047C8D|nr:MULTISPECIES: hypothetical protein [Methylobacterium]MDR7038282.1 hypothetical protein [Methylobacterium sp. BE186]
MTDAAGCQPVVVIDAGRYELKPALVGTIDPSVGADSRQHPQALQEIRQGQGQGRERTG